MNNTGSKIARLTYREILVTQLRKLFIISLVLFFNLSASAQSLSQQALNKGQQLAFERKKGNCLACHYIEGGTLMGNNGPPLVAMKQRFPDRNKLIQQVSDARINNPSTIMPPFGAHGILTHQEIELITDWLLTL